MVSLASAAASIDSYSASNCGSGYQGTFHIESNGGKCNAETSSQGIIVRSVDSGCTGKFARLPQEIGKTQILVTKWGLDF